ncbi:MAG: ORF6N domain-containing protein [Candidatus Cloacimonetes bacterium]|nr:ORF6N domain-containing protein [Candidatus Cloacimonadota bacterium]
MNEKYPIHVESITDKILLIRNQKVMIDSDLAQLYNVTTGRLNEAVKRNIDRFPKDFMFQLSEGEFKNLKSYFAIARWGGRRTPPYAFTEQGVAMLSSVLSSPRAIKVNILIMRAFVKIREYLATNKDLAQRIKILENEVGKHGAALTQIIKSVNRLLVEPLKKRNPIGFQIPKPEKENSEKINLRK